MTRPVPRILSGLAALITAACPPAFGQFVIATNDINISATTNRIFDSTGGYTTNFHTFTVSGLGTVSDVDLRLSVLHSAVGDLDVYLISPTGIQLALTNIAVFSQGGVGNNFQDTYFDEDGPWPRIGSTGNQTAPFAGPEWGGTAYKTQFASDTLDKFDGIDPNGTWTLRVEDSIPGDDGFVLWSGADSLALDNLISSGTADGTGWSTNVFGTQLIITSAIPEPQALGLVVLGLAGVVLLARKSRRE